MEANTVLIKQAQLTKGFFTLGSGKEVILIMGSCRVCPYINYLNDWNKVNGNRFTIHTFDPFNLHWDVGNNRTDYEAALSEQENNQELLTMLRSVDIFIHEYYQNGGMFNTNKSAEKNIYQFGINPKQAICIPSFNDRFVLIADIVRFDPEIRKRAIADYNVTGKLTDQTLSEIKTLSQLNLDSFLKVCQLSDLPGFGVYFENTWKSIRYFHNSNHVSKQFTVKIILLLFEKFLGITPDYAFMDYLEKSPDMFANIFTPITEYDDLQWNEPIKPLRECL